MKICAQNNITFQRRLKPSEEAGYSHVLNSAKSKGKSVLIIPATSLPNKTGVGNIGTKESLEFFDFAKKYWGINEVQILPMGQYHKHNEYYPFYSGTSMDLGSHVINIKDYISQEDYNKIVKSSPHQTHVNFDCLKTEEKALRKIFEEGKFKSEFEKFKFENSERLEPKALYRVLHEINGTHEYKNWNDIDKNLYELPPDKRAKRIEEIKKLKGKEIDFYYFKQFLAEDSLKRAKEELNKRGLKLNGDMICGFSYDEVWANQKAFHKDTTIGWELPALNFDTPEGEKLLREKVKFYAKKYDGIRVDAAETYINQPQIKDGIINKKYYGEKILDIIEEEVKKVKGADFDYKSIMLENTHSKNHIGIYTSDYLSSSWGSSKSFLKLGWNPDSFIIGAKNHDSPVSLITREQKKALSEIYGEIKNEKEFMKLKLAEPMSAKHNMIYFMDALNIEGQFQNNINANENYAKLVPLDYQEKYFSALENGKGFNPMDALERNFKVQGLDKKEPKLFKQIIKYRKILEQKEKQTHSALKWCIGIICSGLMLYGLVKYYKNHTSDSI